MMGERFGARGDENATWKNYRDIRASGEPRRSPSSKTCF